MARDRGRDGCRVPMPWEGDAPSYGFGPTEKSWLPQPAAYGELAVDRQTGVEGSTLELYRTLLRLRREHRLGRGELTWLDLGENVLAFDVTSESGAPVRVIANLGSRALPLPEGEVLVASGELDAYGGCRPTARCGCGSSSHEPAGSATLAAVLLLFRSSGRSSASRRGSTRARGSAGSARSATRR